VAFMRLDFRCKVTAVAALIISIVAVSGCAIRGTEIQPTHQAIAQLGLPVYPRAKPMHGMSINQQMGPMKINTTNVDFMTNDDMAKVIAFYEKRLPKTAQRVSVPMGFASTVTFQFFEGPYQKQVVIASVKNIRMISLRSMQLFQTPSPVPSGK
jgi:hypothetical protein